MDAKTFWDSASPATTFEYIRGLHPYSYNMPYKLLTEKEKKIVRKFVKSLKE